MFTKTWFCLNWHWLFASILFALNHFVENIFVNNQLEIRQQIAYKYKISFLCLLLISICLIFLFLWQKCQNKLAKLERPIPVHHSMRILILLFTTICAMGHSLDILLEMAIWLNGGKGESKGIEGNGQGEAIDAFFQFVLVLFLLLFPFYLFQRSKIGRMGDFCDKFIRHFLNFTICSLWLEFLLFEKDEKHALRMDKLEKKDIIGWLDELRKNLFATHKNEQYVKFWHSIYEEFFEHSICGISTELLSILLVCHLLVSGSGEKIARKVTDSKMMPMKREIWIVPEKEGSFCEDNCSNSNLIENSMQNGRRNIPILDIKIVGLTIAALSICSIVNEILCFLKQQNYSNLWLQFLTNFLIFGLFLALFIFYTKKIPNSILDVNLRAQIQSDFLLLGASILFLFCAFLIDTFSINVKNGHFKLEINDRLDMDFALKFGAETFKMIGILLIFLNIRKFATLPPPKLGQFPFLHFLAICSSIYCAASICHTFFQLRSPKCNSIEQQFLVANYSFYLTSLMIFVDLWHRYEKMKRNGGNLDEENSNGNTQKI